jgi:hypothetical protein
MSDARTAALAAFPELQRLLDLDAAGWVWMQPPTDDDGNPIEIHGLRMWPGTGEADAMRVRASKDAWAVRVDHEGGVLWQQTGGLTDVVEGLIHLPPPGSPYAPKLVVGTAPNDFWRP